jgi:hypothetical protein
VSSDHACPELVALRLGDPAERWESLGFETHDSAIQLGGLELELGCERPGIAGWRLRGVDAPPVIDGLVTEPGFPGAARAGPEHPNGAIGIDHVVVATPDFDRTVAALAEAGIELRRVREAAGGFRQGFRRLGPAILELVEARDAPPGPARFWGLVVIVSDLHALGARLGDRLGAVKDAVQAGRQIATLRRSAGLGEAVAFMSPES